MPQNIIFDMIWKIYSEEKINELIQEHKSDEIFF
jgi:hypothetical protein